MKCELCDKESTDENLIMDFNCMMPSFDAMFRGWICLECFGARAQDMEIVADLLKIRAKARNVELPIKDPKVLATLFNPQD
jgi:hypothetical protein